MQLSAKQQGRSTEHVSAAAGSQTDLQAPVSAVRMET
jgi:hypothetical protein